MAFRSKNNALCANSSSLQPSRLKLSTLSSTACTTFSTSIISPSFNSSNKRALLPCKGENGRIKGWIEAMYASSPPHARSFNGEPFDQSILEATELQYRSWVEKHPSALAFFDRIIDAANGKKVAVFLDYDGTLSPIVEDPDCAFMSEMMRTAVKDIAMHFPTSIISGRCRDKVFEFVKLPEIYYAGSHGMDIMGPGEGCNGVKANGMKILDMEGNKVVIFQPTSEFTAIIEEVCYVLREKTKKVDGVRIENNKYCASIHFRCVKEEDWDILALEVEDVLQDYSELCLTQGRKVLEIRPSIPWNKGKALEFLLDVFGLGSCNDVFPIYIGDDRTDEDAFRVLNKKGLGVSIIVSSAAKETAAVCSLHDPCEVMEFLRRLVNWRIE